MSKRLVNLYVAVYVIDDDIPLSLDQGCQLLMLRDRCQQVSLTEMCGWAVYRLCRSSRHIIQLKSDAGARLST